MPTKEQLESALRNAHDAGDVVAAKRLANAIKQGEYGQPKAQLEASTPVTQDKPALQTLDEAFLAIPGGKAIAEFAAAANRSIFDVIDFFGPDTVNAALQLSGADVRVPTTRQTFGSEGGYMDPGLARDVVQAAGETAPIAVGMGQAFRTAAGMLPAVAPGESVGLGVLRQMGKGTAAQDASFGAMAGAGSAVGEDVGGAPGALIGGLVLPALGGAVAGKFSQVRQAIGQPAPAAQRELQNQADDAGITLLTSDVMPPKTFPGKIIQQTAEKIPFAGTAGVREQQQALRTKAVRDVADKYGEFSYDAILNSLKTQKSRIKNAAGSVLSRVGRRLDESGNIPTSNTQSAIAKAKAGLERQGVIASESAADDLGKLIDALQTPQTFTSLKENRTAFREIVKSTDKAERSQLTSRAKALLEEVYAGMTKDMDDFARNNLDASEFSKWRRANAVYAEEAANLTRSKLKNILDQGDIKPEAVKQMLFSQNPSEQRMLYKSLTTEGRAHARSAIISKIVSDLNRRASGLTPNAFASEMKKYSSHINTFFRGQERRQLEGLRRVLEATTRAQDAAVTTPTGQQLIGGLGVTGIALDPVTTIGTAGTIGGLARLYESPPVRDALLRLGSVPRGSGEYAQSLIAAQLALQAAAETEAAQAEGTK